MPERQTLVKPLDREQQVAGAEPAHQSAPHSIWRSAGSPQQPARDVGVGGGDASAERKESGQK